jgi:hypothetical protein
VAVNVPLRTGGTYPVSELDLVWFSIYADAFGVNHISYSRERKSNAFLIFRATTAMLFDDEQKYTARFVWGGRGTRKLRMEQLYKALDRKAKQEAEQKATQLATKDEVDYDEEVEELGRCKSTAPPNGSMW